MHELPLAHYALLSLWSTWSTYFGRLRVPEERIRANRGKVFNIRNGCLPIYPLVMYKHAYQIQY